MPRWYAFAALSILLWVVLLQASMGTLLPAGANSVQGTVQELGYSFTGLWCLATAWAWVRSRDAALLEENRLWAHARKLLATAAVLGLSGPAYFLLAGQFAERHARSFACLPLVLFLLIPRPWKRS